MSLKSRIGLPATVLSVVAMICATLLLPGPLGSSRASAEPPYATDGTVTAISFTDESVVSGRVTSLEGSWSLPDNATAPAGFVVDLPAGLQGLSDTFDLLDPAGEVMGSCVVTDTQIVCDLDDAYLAAHPLDVSGTFFVNVRVTDEVSEDTTTSYQFGDLSAEITVVPSAGVCTNNCDFKGAKAKKTGFYNSASKRFVWTVTVPLPVTGATRGTSITVTDNVGPGQRIDTDQSPVVLRTKTIGVDPVTGREQPIDYRRVPAGQLTVSSDATSVTFVAGQGFFYQVRWLTIVEDDADLDVFTNDASIVLGNSEPVVVTASARLLQSGGTGQGAGVGGGTGTGSGAVPAPATGSAVTGVAGLALSQPTVTSRVQKKLVRPGAKVKDIVRVSGLVDGGTSRGTATVYGPFPKASIAADQCQPGRAVETVTFDPSNGELTTPSVRLRKPGYYTWVIALSADASNAAATHECGLRSETLMVAKPDYGPVTIDTGYTISASAAARTPSAFRNRAKVSQRLSFDAAGTDAKMIDIGVGARGAMVPSRVGQVGQIDAGAQVGDAVGTAVIVGHVSDRQNRPGALSRLHDARTGQLVRARDDAGRWHTYRVAKVTRYDRSKPLPASIFSTRTKARLALISCDGLTPLPGGRFHYGENVVVIAKQIS